MPLFHKSEQTSVPEEEDTSYTGTADSQGQDDGKKSVISKMKDKAKTKVRKMKNKMGKNSDGQTDDTEEGIDDDSGSNDDVQPQQQAPVSSPADYNPSGDRNISHAPESERGFDGYTGPNQSANDTSATEAPAPELGADGSQPISGFKNDGPPETLQAVPTQYGGYASSNRSNAQEQQSPSVGGQEFSSGVTSDASHYADDSDTSIPEGITKPKDFDTVDSRDFTPSSETTDESKDFTPSSATTDEPTVTENPSGDSIGYPSQDAPNSEMADDQYTNKPAEEFASRDSAPTDETTDGGYTNEPSTPGAGGDFTETSTPSSGNTDYQANTGAAGEDNQSDTASKASGGYGAIKDTLMASAAAAAGAVGYKNLGSGQGKQEEENVAPTTPEGGEGKSWGQWASDNVNSWTSKAPETTSQGAGAVESAQDDVSFKAKDLDNATGDNQSYTQKAGETASGVKDTVMSSPGDVNNATGDNQTYTQKAADTATAVKDSIASTLGLGQNSSSQQPSYTQKASESATGVKDNVASALGWGQNPSSPQPSVIDKAKEYLSSAVDTTKGYVGGATDTAKGYTESAKGTATDYSAKTADSANATKDAAIQKITPGHEDRQLSDQVTETISNFPGQVRGRLFGTLPITSPSNTDSSDVPSSDQQEGLVSRLTGMFFGPKKSVQGEEYSVDQQNDTPTADHSQEGSMPISTPAAPAS